MSDAPDINVSLDDRPRGIRTRMSVFHLTARSSKAFVSSVRGFDLTDASDAELRECADRLKHSVLGEDALAECFAVIDETIRRRIGAWQVFDPEFEHPNIDRYREPDALEGTNKIIADTLAFVADESALAIFRRYRSPIGVLRCD